MTSTISSKGQITIPQALRRRLGLTTGSQIELREEDGHLVGVKIDSADPVGQVYGCLAESARSTGWTSTDALLKALRGDGDES